MRVETTYRDKPVRMYGLSFADWCTRNGPIFVSERIYLDGYKWTPFVRYYKRYDKWLDYFKGDDKCQY